MGWGNGSSLLCDVAKATKKHVKDKSIRYNLYLDFIHKFGDFDCDTFDECYGVDPVLDEALEASGW